MRCPTACPSALPTGSGTKAPPIAISDEWGDLVAEFGGSSEGVLTATLDLDRARKHRAGMGFFRDRRPQLYGRISEDI